MRLEEVLPALREGKLIRRKVWHRDLWICISDGINLINNDNGRVKLVTSHITADDWEIVPEPKRVADYLVPYKGLVPHNGPIIVYTKQTHPIGQQPDGAVMVPGSERNAT